MRLMAALEVICLIYNDLTTIALGEADIVRYWQTCQLEEGEPRRELSKWGRYCPVTFAETDVLNLGSLNECVTYKVLF